MNNPLFRWLENYLSSLATSRESKEENIPLIPVRKKHTPLIPARKNIPGNTGGFHASCTAETEVKTKTESIIEHSGSEPNTLLNGLWTERLGLGDSSLSDTRNFIASEERQGQLSRQAVKDPSSSDDERKDESSLLFASLLAYDDKKSFSVMHKIFRSLPEEEMGI